MRFKDIKQKTEGITAESPTSKCYHKTKWSTQMHIKTNKIEQLRKAIEISIEKYFIPPSQYKIESFCKNYRSLTGMCSHIHYVVLTLLHQIIIYFALLKTSCVAKILKKIIMSNFC